MRIHRATTLFPLLAALTLGCTKDDTVNHGTDPEKEAAEVKAAAPVARAKPRRKVTKPPGAPPTRSTGVAPASNL